MKSVSRGHSTQKMTLIFVIATSSVKNGTSPPMEIFFTNTTVDADWMYIFKNVDPFDYETSYWKKDSYNPGDTVMVRDILPTLFITLCLMLGARSNSSLSSITFLHLATQHLVLPASALSFFRSRSGIGKFCVI